ncbi:MAG: PAS domain-containing protein, partial [Acidobacteriaceae bacterium]
MSPSDRQLIDSVFAGSDETSACLRGLDWSATPLGSLEQWPQALRTIVRVVVASGYPMAICWGPDYVLLYNDAYRPIAGTRHPWALGRGAREVYPEAWDFIGSMYESVMARGQTVNYLSDALVPLTRNNYLEEVYIAFSASPIWDDNGRVGGVLNSALETTERVIEDRRRHLLRDLASRAAGARNEEEVWGVSTETLGENCLSLPFAFLYEYRPSEHQAYLVGASVETNEALHPAVIDCRGESLWRFDPALAMDGVLVELRDLASGVSVPNWPERPKEASVVPIRLGEHGETLGFLVAGIHPGQAFGDAYRQFVRRVAEQITIGLASARAYEQERQRAEALAELDRAKNTFFSNVSHEFRTPLTLMLGPLEEMQMEASERLSPEHHERLITVHRNAIRLLKLVNTLLDFSRIEAGRVQASYQPTDLAHFTTEIASAFDSAMQNAGLRFSIECQPIAEPVYVDRDMWEKIVLNLLSNAYKFTFEGEVALTLKSVDGAVELQVRDTGVGIPEEQRDLVFERFHRIESIQARTYEGTGIGLALVLELVKLHGGNVRVESAAGGGSTFSVTIPTGKEHLSAERIQAAQSLASTTIRAEAYVDEARQWSGNQPGAAVGAATLPREGSPSQKRELIIVADDNADMRQYLARLLSEQYEVHAVVDGRQALEATQRLRPALVLADVMMPQLDGFGLLRAIREDSTLAATPVILVSARAGEESRVEGLEADADDYLIKPFVARELLARVAAHVKMANLRRETAKREERLRSEAELEREKLRASEEQLAQTSRLYDDLQRADAELQLQAGLLHHLPVSAWTLNPDGTPDFVNQVWLDYSGQALDFVRSHPEAWMTAVHPEDREAASKAFWDGVRSGQDFAVETRSLRAHDGTYRWHLQQAVVLRDADGKVLKFVGTTTDIDDQKRAQEALGESETNLRQILDGIPGLVCTLNPAGLIDLANRRLLDFFGMTLEELNSWGTNGAVHPNDLERVIAELTHAMTSGTDFESQLRYRRSDGLFRWSQTRILPARDAEGRITRWYGLITDIDDRKRAEEALRESEYESRLIVDSIPGMVAVTNASGEVMRLSKPLLDYYSKSSEEINSQWATEGMVHPEDRPGLIQAFTRSLASGDPTEFEFRACRFDGVYRWFVLRGRPLRDQQGRIVRWYFLQTDIDDQKRAEEKLRESEYEARLIVNSIPGMVGLTSPNGNLEMVSQQALAFFGKTIEELNEWGTNDTIHPEDLPGVIEAFTRAVTTGRPYEFPARFRRADGVYRWLQDRGSPLRDRNGEIVRWYLLITDIDDQKRAEDALRESEHESRLIVDSIPGLIAVLDTSGEVERVNQPLLDYLGRSLEELRQWAVDDTIHPDDRPGYLQAFERAFAAGDPAEYEAVRIRRFDGVYRWLNMRGLPLRDRQGHIVRWYFLLTDVDDRKRAEDALRQAQSDLACINRVTTMGELAASLAHEV